MNTQQRLTLRAAQVLHETFSCHAAQDRYSSLPDAAWASCGRVVRLIDKAKRQGWAGALRKLEQQLTRSIAECIDELVRVYQPIQTSQSRSKLPRWQLGPCGWRTRTCNTAAGCFEPKTVTSCSCGRCRWTGRTAARAGDRTKKNTSKCVTLHAAPDARCTPAGTWLSGMRFRWQSFAS